MKNTYPLKGSLVLLFLAASGAKLSAATVAVSFTSGFPATTDLTTTGPLDWVQLGYNGTTSSQSTARTEKSGATFIGAITRPTGQFSSFNNNAYSLSWSGGEGTGGAAATGVKMSWEARPDGTTEPSFIYQVSGLATGSYQLQMYGTSFQLAPSFTATIGTVSDSSISAVVGRAGVYTVDFSIATGETLDLNYYSTNPNAATGVTRNIGIGAITLASIPEPSAMLLSALGALGFSFRRRK